MVTQGTERIRLYTGLLIWRRNSSNQFEILLRRKEVDGKTVYEVPSEELRSREPHWECAARLGMQLFGFPIGGDLGGYQFRADGETMEMRFIVIKARSAYEQFAHDSNEYSFVSLNSILNVRLRNGGGYPVQFLREVLTVDVPGPPPRIWRYRHDQARR
ncbi:hypothetical protein GGS21DRAFT_543550 [Xylaria nigripes]|nr:hypothetical protein GGS21DRAFT_543550 [Xylaria nigripes]